jgi:cytochrome c-type biogenesis protein CcmH
VERRAAGFFSPFTGRRWRQPDEGRGAYLAKILLALCLFLTPLPALAVNPDEVLKDPVLEERARNLSAQLRCMVCQNQSIDDSNAELAKDLRLLVRERIVGGDSDQQVIDYVVSRYGEFVLLKPRLSAKTLVLWTAPALLLVIGAGAVFALTRRRATRAPEKLLTPEEQAKLDQILKQ